MNCSARFLKKGLSVALLISYGGLWSGMWTLPTTWAAVSSCGASVTPTSIGTNTTDTLQFSVANTDSVAIRWVRLTAPSEAFEITTGSTAGWASTIESPTQIIFKFGTMGPGASQTFSVTVQTGVATQSSQAWTVEASDTTGGAAPYGCGGSAAVAIAPPSNPPVLSSITASTISASGATITWSTDKSADSFIAYGPTAGYGSTSADTTLRTSHSRSLTGLTAGTTYHYQVRSTDAAGNTTTSADNTFTTAAAEATPTPTPSPTATPAATPAISVTPTPAPTASAPVARRVQPTPPTTVVVAAADTLSPRVRLRAFPTEPVAKPELITGIVQDDTAVDRVQFSTDGGRNWLPVDQIRGRGESEVSFSFTPRVTADGNYEVVVRAIDGSGNVGLTTPFELIIDQAPPSVGTALFSLGPQVLQPNEEGLLVGLPGLDYTVVVTAQGGATQIDLQSNDATHSLVHHPGSSVWSGALSVTKPGSYTLVARTQDGAANTTEKSLGTFVALPGGQVVDTTGQPVPGANVELYYWEEAVADFVPWRATAFNQQNPQITGVEGYFYFAPPAGRYYVSVTAPGWRNAQTTVFALTHSQPLFMNIPLERPSLLAWSTLSVPVDIPTLHSRGEHPLLHEKLPAFMAVTTTGEEATNSSLTADVPQVVSFMTGWSPQASEQMSILTTLHTQYPQQISAIVSETTPLSTRLWQTRGRYTVPILTDPLGELQEQLSVSTTPLHFILDSEGVVREVMSGLLSEARLQELLH